MALYRAGDELREWAEDTYAEAVRELEPEPVRERLPPAPNPNPPPRATTASRRRTGR